jgi:hypothetical protein
MSPEFVKQQLEAITAMRDSAEARIAQLETALRELVACKDLKDEESRLRQRRECSILRQPNSLAEANAMRDDYNRRKPLAWSAARAAAPSPAQPEPRLRGTGWVAPRDRYVPPVLFNPYTGEPRDVRDVQSDPQGILIVPPGAQMVAAAPARPEPTALVKASRDALDALEQLQGGCTDSGDGTVEEITVWCPEIIDALRAAMAGIGERQEQKP